MRADKLGDALVSAGFSREEMELGAAVTKFLKSGGSLTSAHAVVDAAAERMPGRGQQSFVAPSDRPPPAPTRQPVEGGGARLVLPDKGHNLNASPSSSNRGGEGHRQPAHVRPSMSALPVREPTASQITAMKIVKKELSVFDTFKIDGVPVGDWSVARARVEGRRKTRDGYILREAVKVVANAPDHASLRDVLKLSEMQRIRQNAEEAADAV